MSSIVKFFGGLILGAAVGTGVYLIFTKDSEDGVINDVKMIANDAILQGKQAAEARRIELENELRQPLSPPTPPMSSSELTDME